MILIGSVLIGDVQTAIRKDNVQLMIGMDGNDRSNNHPSFKRYSCRLEQKETTT